MSDKTEQQGATSSGLDAFKWLVVLALGAAAVVGNTYYAEQQPLLIRAPVLIVIGVLAAFIALTTARGIAFWSLVKEARTEIRKVVWPTRQETNQTTLLVVGVVLVVAVILWGLDTLIGWLMSLIIG
jgi:preprotein translocase subunit SecE